MTRLATSGLGSLDDLPEHGPEPGQPGAQGLEVLGDREPVEGGELGLDGLDLGPHRVVEGGEPGAGGVEGQPKQSLVAPVEGEKCRLELLPEVTRPGVRRQAPQRGRGIRSRRSRAESARRDAQLLDAPGQLARAASLR